MYAIYAYIDPPGTTPGLIGSPIAVPWVASIYWMSKGISRLDVFQTKRTDNGLRIPAIARRDASPECRSACRGRRVWSDAQSGHKTSKDHIIHMEYIITILIV